jgi:plastocyanin
MKRKILLLLLVVSTGMTGYSTVWIITNSGDTFSPSSITITFGDTVNFVLASEHDAREVSLETWNANGITPLPGGFQTPFGGGLVLPEQLGVGTHYYVCTPHAVIGMKGTIIVESTTGISDNPLQTNISVFPNPANDLITIATEGNMAGSTFIITDLTGKLHMTGELHNNTTTVDISQLTNGVYLFQAGVLRKQTFKILKR